jgi:S1-C subfamily serine protease
LPGLSVARINPAVMSELNLPLEAQGVVVVDAGPFAARVGLRRGDVILSVNGVEVDHPDAIADLLDGQTRRIEMIVQRGNQRSLIRFRI